VANSGIARVDNLLLGSGSPPIKLDDSDREAVGVVQDFLISHGFGSRLPDVRDRLHGLFGPRTQEAVRAFQQSAGSAVTGAVDSITLRTMIDVPAVTAIACRGYLTLVLDRAFTGMLKIMSLTTQFEGAGRFGAMNRNSDKAGLSFGLIQWAQKPLRLNELLRAFDAGDHKLFVKVFGGGNEAAASGLLEHTARERGGTAANGETLDARFDLIRDPWLSRFRECARQRVFQNIQVQCALEAFEKSFRFIQSYAPDLRSERAVAFMLDVANQHGDHGARALYRKVRPSVAGPAEPAILKAIEEASVEAIQAQFGEDFAVAVRHRRESFRTTSLLSDIPF
jgi:peptidoglycan hydrolase-like protein with peptidoglycan-binding domain